MEELEELEEWKKLPKETKEDCFRYLILMRRFKSSPKLLSPKIKKWILGNCDLPTHLIPHELMDGYWLQPRE